MNEVNIKKYRKLLAEIQAFCSDKKKEANCSECRTDNQNGVVQGKHAAYNEVLKLLHSMIRHAEYDWSYVKCRDERRDDF